MVNVAVGVRTDKGCCRDNNEDYYLSDQAQSLYVVADGIGGHDAGEVASRIACETIQRAVKQGVSLVNSLAEAHQAILDGVDRGEGANGMGSTVVALKLSEDQYEIAWVGDSRAYLWDQYNLVQLSRDHSLVQELVDNEFISIEEARVHPQRNVITQALGIRTENSAKHRSRITGQLDKGQQILLCSDGLYDELSDQEIIDILTQRTSVQTQVDELVEAALNAGGRDNITVMLVAPKPSSSFVPNSLSQWIKRIIERVSFPGWTVAGVALALVLGFWLLS